MNRLEFFAAWSQSHGAARVTGIVRAWLTLSYFITKPLIALRISPNFLTLLSLAVGVQFVFAISSNWAILLLVVSLLLDGIDGTVAIIRNRATRFGAFLDAVADRIVEACWAYGFYLMGAPWQLVAIAWLAAFLQEYMRARATGLGIDSVVIVTPAERPVRASLLFIALVARAVGIDLLFLIALVWAALQSFSALRLLAALRSQLQQSPR